ncbi:MAG: nucleotidyltransferase family protein [Candidatus Micrarchaeia archaeon]
MQKSHVKDAIIIAGGEGTRLRPITYEIPKPLVRLNGTPLIEYAISELERNGISTILLSIGYKSKQIIDYFEQTKNTHKASISYVVEEKPLGTGGAIRYAINSSSFSGDVVIANADTVYSVDLNAMYKVHQQEGSLVTIGTFVVDDVTGFGVVKTLGSRITEFVEKPDPNNAPSRIINAGIYIASPSLKSKLPQKESFSFEKDFLQVSCTKEVISAFPIDRFITVNSNEQLEKAEKILRNE